MYIYHPFALQVPESSESEEESDSDEDLFGEPTRKEDNSSLESDESEDEVTAPQVSNRRHECDNIF